MLRSGRGPASERIHASKVRRRAQFGKDTACDVQLQRRGFLVPEDAASLCDKHAHARGFVRDLELPPCLEGPPQSTERRFRLSLGEFGLVPLGACRGFYEFSLPTRGVSLQ